MKHQLILNYDDDVHNALIKLRQLSECKDEPQVIRKALTYYHYLLKEISNGGKIILQKEDKSEIEIDIK